MNHYIEKNDRNESILQGDIFKIGKDCRDNFNEDENFAVVITADCDIAQKKMGNYYTLLPVISVESYIENYWLPKFYKIETSTIFENHVKSLNASKLIKEDNYDALTEVSLIKWLETDSLENIYQSLNIKWKPKYSADIDCLTLLNQPHSLANYYKIKKEIRSKTDDQIEKELKNAVSKDSGGEFFHIPEVPFIEGLGCIVKLRNVRSIHKNKVYLGAFEIRLSESSVDDVIYRVGQFPDYLRYSITQKFANLFSRIGMPDYFEEAEKSSLQIFAQNMVETIK